MGTLPPLPDWVWAASTPPEIIKAADWLRTERPSSDAIEPLARLSRQAPGYLTMLGGLLVHLLLFLAGSWLVYQALSYGFRVVGVSLIMMVEAFYADQALAWWIAWAGLMALWFWRDGRLRGLTHDPRFDLPEDDLTKLWVILLWPIHMLARLARLSAAALFLALLLALPLFALWTLARHAQDPHLLEQPDYARLITLGVSSSALLLVFGLFVFSAWPRGAREIPNRTSWLILPTALLLSAGVGAFVWWAAPAYGLGPVVMVGAFCLLLFHWFLRHRAQGRVFDLSWARSLRTVELTRGQRRFLAFLLLLLGLIGMGVIFLEIDQAQTGLPDMPLLMELARLRAASPLLVQAPSWLLSSAAGAVLIGVGAVYLSGLAIVLARPFAWPFFLLRSAALSLIHRHQTQQAVREAKRHHRRRNLEQVAGHGELAVCRQDLARFEAKSALLSYSRRWRYWQCRACHSDEFAATNIRLLQGVFNQDLEPAVECQDSVLRVNMLKRPSMPLDLQEIVAERLDDPSQLEAFAVEYAEFRPPVKIPPPHQIRVRILPGVRLNVNTERILRGNKYKVEISDDGAGP